LKAKSKKPRPASSESESGFDMKTEIGNLQKEENSGRKTDPSAQEHLWAKTRTDGKTARKTKRRTH